MQSIKSTIARFEVGHSDAAVPVPSIVGPLLGLVYIVLLPCIGIVTFILVGYHRAKQSLVSEWGMRE